MLVQDDVILGPEVGVEEAAVGRGGADAGAAGSVEQRGVGGGEDLRAEVGAGVAASVGVDDRGAEQGGGL